MNELLLRPIVEAALREDIRSGDVTTAALILTEATKERAEMRLREDGVVCGLDLARLAFESVQSYDSAEHVSRPQLEVEVERRGRDGRFAASGATLLIVEGDPRAILTAERVALNFVQRLSGIATLTRQFVDAVEGTNARIADTRKTTPGLRMLEKYAVKCGGGSNHRFALDDLILIKDNHIALCGGITEAVQRAKNYAGHALKIEVECDTLEQVEEVARANVDIILLDNMTPEQLRQAVQLIDGRATTEASGGVNLKTVRAIAETGVNVISVGALTHGARSLDIGLDIEIS